MIETFQPLGRRRVMQVRFHGSLTHTFSCWVPVAGRLGLKDGAFAVFLADFRVLYADHKHGRQGAQTNDREAPMLFSNHNRSPCRSRMAGRATRCGRLKSKATNSPRQRDAPCWR